MRNLLALVGAATVTFLAVGWYLGWYQVSSRPSQGGKQSLSVEINPTKITDDVKKGVEKGSEIVDHLRDKSNGDRTPAPGPATDFFSPAGPAKSPPPNSRTDGPRRPDDDSSVFGFRLPRN